MSRQGMTPYRALLLVLLAAFVDFVARLAVGFDMARVALTEAILFAGVSTVLVWLTRTSPQEAKAAHRVTLALAAAFGLATVRAAVWAMGAPVFAANLTMLGVAVVGGVGLLFRWRKARHQRRCTVVGGDAENAR